VRGKIPREENAELAPPRLPTRNLGARLGPAASDPAPPAPPRPASALDSDRPPDPDLHASDRGPTRADADADLPLPRSRSVSGDMLREPSACPAQLGPLVAGPAPASGAGQRWGRGAGGATSGSSFSRPGWADGESEGANSRVGSWQLVENELLDLGNQSRFFPPAEDTNLSSLSTEDDEGRPLGSELIHSRRGSEQRSRRSSGILDSNSNASPSCRLASCSSKATPANSSFEDLTDTADLPEKKSDDARVSMRPDSVEGWGGELGEDCSCRKPHVPCFERVGEPSLRAARLLEVRGRENRGGCAGKRGKEGRPSWTCVFCVSMRYYPH
jgi:hypothetical protein